MNCNIAIHFSFVNNVFAITSSHSLCCYTVINSQLSFVLDPSHSHHLSKENLMGRGKKVKSIYWKGYAKDIRNYFLLF